jgi:MFS family permease
VGLGLLDFVEDKTGFIVFSFIWKFLCGVGAGINSTSSFAIIATHYKEDREKAIGMLEASSGVGLLLGPLIGSILYEIGGYTLPFIGTGKDESDQNFIYSIFLLLDVPLNCIHLESAGRYGGKVFAKRGLEKLVTATHSH